MLLSLRAHQIASLDWMLRRESRPLPASLGAIEVANKFLDPVSGIVVPNTPTAPRYFVLFPTLLSFSRHVEILAMLIVRRLS